MTNRKYFVSWSGNLSQEVAKHLMVLFGQLLPFWEGWFSKQDISDTRDWLSQLVEGLQDPQLEFGIVVLTRTNLHRDWVLLESGALMMKLGFTRVVPVVVDLRAEDLLEHPLEKYPARSLERDDLLALVLALNASTEGPRISPIWVTQRFDEYFPKWRPRLEEILRAPRPDTPPSLTEATHEILRLVKEKDKPRVPATELGAPQRKAVELLQGAIGQEPVDPMGDDAQPETDGPSGLHLWEAVAAASRRRDPES